MAPAQLRASHAASNAPHGGRGARMSSMSSWITASVAAVPPASAVSRTPPASTASMAAPTPRAATVPSCQVRGWRVKRMAAGTRTMRPNATATPSIRSPNHEPNASGARFSSWLERTGSHSASRASTAPHAPAPTIARPGFSPARPNAAEMPPARTGRATGARSASDGTRLLSAQAVDCRAQVRCAFLQLFHDVERCVGAEFRIGQLCLGLFEVGRQLPQLRLPVTVALAFGKAHKAGRCAERCSALQFIGELDPRQPCDQPGDIPIRGCVEKQLASTRWGAGRLAVAAHLLDDSHHITEGLLRGQVHEFDVRPGRAHQVIAMAGRSRPELFRHERHEWMKDSEQVVEAVVGDVLSHRVAIP